MKIGYFGDSFMMQTQGLYSWVDLLSADLGAEITMSGSPGASIIQTIRDWESVPPGYPDIAIVCFSYIHRHYNEQQYQQQFLISPLHNHNGLPDAEWNEFSQAYRGYIKWIWSEYEMYLNYRLRVKFFMDLPKQYPNVKFIFLPITDVGQRYARECHSGGVLFDFEFEAISNNELGASTEMQVNDTRNCHMSLENNKRFARLVKGVIDGWEDHKNSIFPVDYSQFELKTLPAPRVYAK